MINLNLPTGFTQSIRRYLNYSGRVILRLFVPKGRHIATTGWNRFSNTKFYSQHGFMMRTFLL